jgi:hypothetical protein
METRLLRAAQHLRLPPSSLRHLSRHSSSNSFKPPSSDSNASIRQAHPIGDYYASILEASTPEVSSLPPTTATRSSEPPISTTEKDADTGPAILFSSRLSSPLERRNELKKKSVLVAGIWVPPKPEEPDNCCMSGCVNCVWDRYGEEVEEWAAKSKEADIALHKEMSFANSKRKKKFQGIGGTGLMLGDPEKGAAHTLTSMDDDGGGSEGNWTIGLTTEDLFKGVPVGIREFMKQEKRLKEKHAREGTGAG